MKAWQELVVTYDISADHRREKVAELLSAHGPRVQLSVFEVRLPSCTDVTALINQLEELIEPDEDQIRMYSVNANVEILGSRVLEERASYWVITGAVETKSTPRSSVLT